MFGTIFDRLAADPLQLVWLLLLSVVGSVVAVAIYRLTVHPLAKYPGPLLGRLTDFYSVYHAWAGERHLVMHRLHEKYGPIVRYGPNSVSFNSGEALQTIYGFKSNQQKAIFYSAFPAAKGAWSTHSAIDRAMHARKRRVMSQAFSDNAMRGLEWHILSVIRTFCDAVGDRNKGPGSAPENGQWSTPKDMADWTNYMSYDVLGDICYGQSFGTLEREDNRFAMHMVATSSRYHYLNAQMPFLKKLGLDRVLFPTLLERRTRFMAYSRARLDERMRLGTDTDRRDFFYYLLKARDPETGQGFPQRELWGESNVLLIAGSDTTSTALAATLFYLLRHPHILAELTSQVRSTFTALEDMVSGPALSGIRLLRACVDEAMRLAPPVPTLLPREVLAGGMAICGHDIPAGTVVGTPTFSLHRNPAHFDEPLVYNPQRWIAPAGDDKAAERVKRAQAAFAPFSIGARGCIGKGVAYLELSVALSRLLWLYDLRIAPGCETRGVAPDGTYALRDIFVAEKHGPVVQVRRREGV